MAKKRTEAIMPATADELRLVRLQLPPAEHKEFRKLAADEETSMALLARRLVLEYIARRRKETGGK